MLITDIFQLATRMFRTNRSRTILTILGISVGIGAILFLVSLGYGLQVFILNRITNSEALLSLDVNSGELENLKLDKETVEGIKATPGVDKISPLVSLQAQMVVDDISSELQANFTNNEYFRLDGTTLKSGTLYTDEAADNNKVIVSSAALQLFNLAPDQAIGKNINFTLFPPAKEGDAKGIVREFVELPESFTISGIIEEENSSYVYLPLAVSEPLEIDNYNQLKVKVNTEEDLDPVRNAIMEKGFVVSALSDIIEQANQIFTVIQIVLASFGIVALIVSAIGMFNTMTIALLERTQEIGIMKALGATSADIWNMFLSESVIIGFLGGMGGITIGMAGGEIFNYGINLLAGALGGEKIDMFYTPLWFILIIISFSTLVGLLTGFYPARRAARINCLEALRYK
jgi:putative ABC transport system permease protein